MSDALEAIVAEPVARRNYLLSDSTAIYFSTLLPNAYLDTAVVGISDVESLRVRLINLALVYSVGGYTKGGALDASRTFFGITKESPSWKIAIHDAAHFSSTGAALSSILYAVSGVHDPQQLAYCAVMGAGMSTLAGTGMQYARSIQGSDKHPWVPQWLHDAPQRTKKTIAIAALSAVLAGTVVTYAWTPPRQPQHEQSIDK
jgi:hypothetical protein